jgi:hypothetical protein
MVLSQSRKNKHKWRIVLRKFLVRASFRKAQSHQINRGGRQSGGDSALAERDFEILADNPDGAKVKVRELLKREGYGEISLEHITWTASRLNRPRKK